MATVDWLPFVEPYARRPLVIDTNLLSLAAAIGAAGGAVVNYNHIRFPL